MNSGRRLALVALFLTFACPLSGAAQAVPVVGLDVALRTRSVWRGITRHDSPVLQTDALLSYWSRELSVTAGAWGNIAFSAADSSGVGFGQEFLGESNVWLELAGTVGPALLSGGWIGRFFRTEGAVGPAADLTNTHELYVRVEFPTLPVLAPRLAIYHDIDAVRGVYLEPGLTVRVPVWAGLLFPAGSLRLGAAAGVSFGQALDRETAGTDGLGYYAGSGLTHLDFSAEITVGRIPLGVFDAAVHLELLHVQFNRDPGTKLTDAQGEERDVNVWVGVVVSLLGPQCRPADRICAHE
jgi:hypothetical protein